MKVLLLLTMFILSGCGGNIFPKDIAKAEEICKDKGGIFAINPVLAPTVVCKHRLDAEDNKNHYRLR
jgi:hypothetical protein